MGNIIEIKNKYWNIAYWGNIVETKEKSCYITWLGKSGNIKFFFEILLRQRIFWNNKKLGKMRQRTFLNNKKYGIIVHTKDKSWKNKKLGNR